MITQALTPLETLIDAAVTYPAFADACRAAFSGRAGEDVLSALTAVAHPLFPPEGRTPEAVAREIGRREVVALLLRASGNISPTPSHARPTNYGIHSTGLDDLAATTGPAAFTITRLPDQPEQPAAQTTEEGSQPAPPASYINAYPSTWPINTNPANPAERPADADAIRAGKAPDDAGRD